MDKFFVAIKNKESFGECHSCGRGKILFHSNGIEKVECPDCCSLEIQEEHWQLLLYLFPIIPHNLCLLRGE